jgi:hypothetical protein
MTLSEQQIEELFRFCKKKYVHYYDLQVELVDHLATRIEEEMAADDRLGFADALQKVYAGFGLFGFAHVVQEKQAALQKQSNRAWWRAVKAFFTWPKLVFTAALFMVLYTAGSFLSPDLRWLIVCAVLLVGFVREVVLMRRMRKSEKKAMLLTQYTPAGNFVSFIVYVQIINVVVDGSLGLWPFVLILLVAFIFHSALIAVTRRIYQQAREQYPLAFVASR